MEFLPFITYFKNEIESKYKIKLDEYYEDNEFVEILLSACRCNEFGMIRFEKGKQFLDETNMMRWVKEKLIPNTVIMKIDDEDIIRLLIFSMEITYQMFRGGTRATITQKGFRERRRTFESIIVDQFIGKLGEIALKKFLEKNFKTKIELDWEISPKITKFRSDILNAKHMVSIKTTPTLSSIWAEADKNADYGIFVKCSVPQQPLLQFFIEVCGFSKLLDFAKEKIPSSDKLFQNYLGEMTKRIKDYKCGTLTTTLKALIYGYFKTTNDLLINKGKKLKHLGEVREERYLIRIDKLKYSINDWGNFLIENGLK